MLKHRQAIEKKEADVRNAHAAWVARQKKRAAAKKRALYEEQHAAERLKKRKADFEASLINKERKRQEVYFKSFSRVANVLRAGGGPLGMDRAFNTYYFFPNVDKSKLYVLPGDGDGDYMPGNKKIGSETLGRIQYRRMSMPIHLCIHAFGRKLMEKLLTMYYSSSRDEKSKNEELIKHVDCESTKTRKNSGRAP